MSKGLKVHRRQTIKMSFDTTSRLIDKNSTTFEVDRFTVQYRRQTKTPLWLTIFEVVVDRLFYFELFQVYSYQGLVENLFHFIICVFQGKNRTVQQKSKYADAYNF